MADGSATTQHHQPFRPGFLQVLGNDLGRVLGVEAQHNRAVGQGSPGQRVGGVIGPRQVHGFGAAREGVAGNRQRSQHAGVPCQRQRHPGGHLLLFQSGRAVHHYRRGRLGHVAGHYLAQSRQIIIESLARARSRAQVAVARHYRPVADSPVTANSGVEFQRIQSGGL